jgi:pimeloyl-ACP methyl ester carboxylesterase
MRRLLTVIALVVLSGAAARAQEPKDGFFTASDGVKIHYLTLGDTGSWVVLIHGYSDSARRMWFSTGIAQAIAKSHRVVAIDNRNHGQSDKPQPSGSGRADDTIELMEHLKIQRAHIHGYSMGGGFVGQLLGKIPDRFLTAGFGGSGMTETDPDLRARATALDEALPKATGADAAAMERFRSRVSTARTSGALAPAGGASPGRGGAAQNPAAPGVDLTKVTVPIIAINGSFDNPYSKTMRLWREVKVFHNVILPEKTHLTAISSGAAMPRQYIEEIARFIEAYDVK